MSNPFKESYISSARSSFSKKPIKFLKMLKAHLYIGFRKSHSFRVSLPFQLTESTVKIHITNHTIKKFIIYIPTILHQLFKEKKNSLFFQVRYPMFDLSYCNIYITMLSTYKAKKNEVLKKIYSNTIQFIAPLLQIRS